MFGGLSNDYGKLSYQYGSRSSYHWTRDRRTSNFIIACKALDFELTISEVNELEDSVSKIKIVGDRYPADEQKIISR